jgi:hypothetical protein
VIVNALDQNNGKCAEVAAQLESDANVRTSAAPMVVVAPRNAIAGLATSLPHCDVVPGPLSSRTLLRAVSRVTPPPDQELAACDG